MEEFENTSLSEARDRAHALFGNRITLEELTADEEVFFMTRWVSLSGMILEAFRNPNPEGDA